MYIDVAEGVIVAGQFPRNGKLYSKTIAELIDLGTNNYKAFRYYEGMIVFCLETKTHYIWKEVDNNPILSNSSGRARPLRANFTYPEGTIANGIDYSLRVFNFFVFNSPQVEENTTIINSLTLGSEILSGSVLWSGTDFVFYSTPIIYRVNRNIRTAPENLLLELTNLPTTPGFKKIYVFAVDTDLNEVVIIEGDESINGIEPNVDFTKQIRINSVIVSEGETEPGGFSIYAIYAENQGEPNEFNFNALSLSGSTVIANDITDPLDTVSIALKAIDPGDGFEMVTTTPRELRSLSSLSFEINNYLIRPEIEYEFGFKLMFLNGTDLIAFTYLQNGDYGFYLNATGWQLINIPIELFQIGINGTIFDRVVFQIYSVPQLPILDHPIILIDNINANSGMPSTITPRSWLSLNDTFESNYIDKKGFLSRTTQEENGLQLVHPGLVPINGEYYVRKANLALSDINVLEIGDEVYFKKITNSGDPKTLIGHTYNGGDDQEFASYTQNQSIEI